MKFTILLLAPLALFAQDTRNVSEPVIPAACSTLTAALSTNLSEADESKTDTARIQKALDGCAKGKAVELKSAEGGNAFLSGPLNLPAGVTLLIDSGVTLMASRDPRLFDITPGAC